MRLRTVDPTTITIPAVRVTNYLPPELEAEFKATVATMGVVEPPICIDENGTLICVDGKNRIQEAISQGIKRLQVVVRQGDLTEAMMLNLVTATMKGKPKLGEIVRVLSDLYHTRAVPLEELYKRTGLPERYVDDLLVISEGGAALTAAVDDGVVGKTHALLLAQLHDPNIRDKLLMAQLAYHYSVEQLREVIKVAVQPVVPVNGAGQEEPLEPPPPVPCAFCASPLRPQELRAFSMCPSCLAVATEYGHSRMDASAGAGGP